MNIIHILLQTLSIHIQFLQIDYLLSYLMYLIKRIEYVPNFFFISHLLFSRSYTYSNITK